MDSEKIKSLKDFKKLKNLGKDRLVIFFLAGILLLVIQLPVGESTDRSNIKSKAKEEKELFGEEDVYVSSLEDQLEELLEQVDGAGRVKVMVTLNSSAEKVVEKDRGGEQENTREEDSAGGIRQNYHATEEETTVYEDGEDQEGNPYVSKELTPKVEGVVVLAAGGDNALVKKNITEAVQALFGIDTHKIRIIKMSEK